MPEAVQGDGNKAGGAEGANASVSPAAPAKPTKPAEAQIQVPDKFKGKKFEDVVKSYTELEAMHGKTANKNREYEEMFQQLKPFEKEILALVTGEQPPAAAPVKAPDDNAGADNEELTGLTRGELVKAIAPVLANIVAQEIQKNFGPQIKKQQEDDVSALKREYGEENFLRVASSLGRVLKDPISKAESFRLAAMRMGLKSATTSAATAEAAAEGDDGTPPPDDDSRSHVSRRSAAPPSPEEMKKVSQDFMERLKRVKPSRKLLGD